MFNFTILTGLLPAVVKKRILLVQHSIINFRFLNENQYYILIKH